MLSQIPEHGRRVGTVLRVHLPRALRDDARQIREGLLPPRRLPELGAAPRVPVRLAEVGHVERERPALLVGEPAKARHARSADAERDGAVEAVDASLRHALAIVEIGGRRIEALACRPVAPPLGAVAQGALRGVERARLREIGRPLGRHLDAIRLDHRPPEPRRQRGHVIPGPLVLHQPDQPIGVGRERRPLRPRLELPDQAPGLHDELHLLVVFPLVQDLSVLDRPGVVHPHVVQHVQDDLGPLGRRGRLIPGCGGLLGLGACGDGHPRHREGGEQRDGDDPDARARRIAHGSAVD